MMVWIPLRIRRNVFQCVVMHIFVRLAEEPFHSSLLAPMVPHIISRVDIISVKHCVTFTFL